MYLGSWKIDDNLTFPCNTHSPTTGAGTDADSVPSYRVYEDETGTPLLTGSMAKLDDANTVGFYSEQIALSAANGFEKGKSYTIYISATVSSVTGTMSHSFQIEAEVDANRLNWANVDNPTTTVGLSGTSIKTATDVETDTADIQSKIGTPAGASMSADIADVEGKVDDLETRLGTPSDLGSGATIAANLVDIESQTDDIGAAGAGLTALPWNASWDAEVQSEVQDAIEVNHLDHLLAADYDPASKPGVATALLNELVESDAGVSRFTANALEEAPTGGSAPTAGEIADAVWDEALADHNAEDSFGNVINDLVDEDGGGVYQFSENALELAPSGSGVGDWTSDEKEQIRYRLQLDGTQTAPATDAPLQMPVSADAVSQDETAADNLEAMLDGNRAKLYLSQLDIEASGNDSAIKAFGAGSGSGIYAKGGINANGIKSEAQGLNFGIVAKGPNGGIGAEATSSGYGILCFGLGINSAGIYAVGERGLQVAGTAGAGLNVILGGTSGIQADSLGPQAKADVNAEMDAALGDYDAPTKAELDAALAALNNLSAAQVQTKIEEFWQTFALPELEAGQSPAEATPAEIMAFLWMYFRGPQESEKTGETTGIQRVHNDAGDIVLDAAFTKTETEYTREKLSLGD